MVEMHGADDMEFKIDGRKGFAGTIAVYEDIYGGEAMYGERRTRTPKHRHSKIKRKQYQTLKAVERTYLALT